MGANQKIIITTTITAAAIFTKKSRSTIKHDIKNFKWFFLIDILTILSPFSVYIAMNGLPASVVASIAAIQPMYVLFLENIVHKFIGKISKDEKILPKLIPIALIVIGVIILYITELV